MSGVEFEPGFPPTDTVLRWVDPDGTAVEAIAETFRESAGFRIYNLRTPCGELITAVMDVNPDTGVLSMVATRGTGQSIRVTPETRDA